LKAQHNGGVAAVTCQTNGLERSLRQKDYSHRIASAYTMTP